MNSNALSEVKSNASSELICATPAKKLRHGCGRTIDDLPNEILQKGVFINCLNAWDRMIAEQVCKRWKQLITYPETSLNVFRVIVRMLEKMHNLQLIHAPHSWEDCRSNMKSSKFSTKLIHRCLRKFLIHRRMAAQLKTLSFLKNDNDNRMRWLITPKICWEIVYNCRALEKLEIDCRVAEKATAVLFKLLPVEKMKSFIYANRGVMDVLQSSFYSRMVNIFLDNTPLLEEFRMNAVLDAGALFNGKFMFPENLKTLSLGELNDEFVDIEDAEPLLTFQSLALCRNLRHLEIEDDSCVEDYESLNELKELEIFKVLNGESFRSVEKLDSFCKNHRKLRVFHISVNINTCSDLSPISFWLSDSLEELLWKF